jgi:hypothetical protein
MFAVEEIEIDPFILAFEFLDFDSKLTRERDQVGMVRVHQLAP